LCLLLTKARSDLQQQKVSHKALISIGSQISFVFPPHKLSAIHIFTNVGQLLKTVILQATANAQRHQHTTSKSAYFDYMRIANTTDSQKLPCMLLATTKVLQIQSQIPYFQMGKI
jgi:hypothetical protein